MNVGELIKRLRRHDPESLVLGEYDHADESFKEIGTARIRRLALNADYETYTAPWDVPTRLKSKRVVVLLVARD